MPECAELRPAAVRPVAVLPLWRRGGDGQERNADRPGVLRGQPGSVAAEHAGQVGQVGREREVGAARQD